MLFFKPRYPKAASLHKVNTALTAGTVVRQRTDGFLEVATSGTGALGFLAVDVRDWASRTEKEILFPEEYFGWVLSPEWINQPQVLFPKLVGVRIGADYEYEVPIDDTLVPDDELVADANGQLIKKPMSDGRTTLAIVKEPGTGVGLHLDYRTNPVPKTWIIRTKI